MHNNYKKIVSIVVVGLFLAGLFELSLGSQYKQDTVQYEGETYSLLDYPSNIYFYDYISNEYMEEDVIYPVTDAQWKMAYTNGDMYVLNSDEDMAESYYADDANYEWCIKVEVEENESAKSLNLSEDEINRIYELETHKKELAIFWDEIEKFGTLMKISKDGVIEGRTELAFYEGAWYWRTEIIDDSKEEDGTWPEYVQKLPDSLTNKIEEE